jgi:hypothetical protein
MLLIAGQSIRAAASLVDPVGEGENMGFRIAATEATQGPRRYRI